MYVDWGPPHLSLLVCYILHLLIPFPCKTWYFKECNKTYENLLSVIRTLRARRIKLYLLQPPKYLILIVKRFRYTNNHVTKDKCSIPMDTIVMLSHLKFSLRATIDHHGPSIHSGHYNASINCCKKHSITTTTKLRILKSLIAKKLLYRICYT